MRHLAASRHFKKQLQKLPPQDRQKTVDALKHFLESLKTGKIPQGLGFKKINGDKYEIRVHIRLRIALKADGDTLICHLVGDHETLRKYLKDYRTR